MEKDELDHYIKAGKVAAQCLQYGKSLIKPGALVVDVLDKVEEKILSMGYGIAFPAQISFNDVAAHTCSGLNDTTEFSDQVIKIDIGTHSEGFVADTALTVDLSGQHTDLLEASKKALEKAISLVKPGALPNEIGGAIAQTIQSFGFKPIKNLSGHGIGEWTVHGAPTIPNYDTGSLDVLEEGMAIAIEPFASTGTGRVSEQGECGVYMQINEKPVRDMISRKALKIIENQQGLPFAKRWIQKELGEAKANYALRMLKRLEIIHEYPPLVDVDNALVSQFEHSMIVTEDGVLVTTKREE